MTDPEPKRQATGYRAAPARALGKVLLRSALNPLHVSIAAGSAGATWLSGLWPLAALGGATFLALVAWDVASPEFWKRALKAPDALPQPSWKLADIDDPTLRARCAEVRKARVELDEVASAHPDVAELLESVLSGARQLDARALAIAERADHLASYLKRTDVAAIRAEVEQLRARAKSTKDPEMAAQYTKIVGTREQHLAAIADISAGLERAFAQLLRIRATFEGLSARILRLSALDADARNEATGGMNAELDEVNGDLEAFEEVLRGLQPMGTNA